MKKQTKQKIASNRSSNPQIQFVPSAMFVIAVQPSQQNVASLFGWEVVAMPVKASTTTRSRRSNR